MGSFATDGQIGNELQLEKLGQFFLRTLKTIAKIVLWFLLHLGKSLVISILVC